MAVSPEQLRSLRFDEGLRGYDKRQVDKVIARVADLVEELQHHVREVEARAAAAEARAVAPAGAKSSSSEAAELDETLRRTLILAQKTADAAVKEAREEAAQIRGQARSEAEAVVAEARQHAERATADADEQHRRTLAEAESERGRLVAEARQRCEERIAAVEAELAETHESRRRELVDQIDQLTEVRNLLADDVELLEDHLGRRRAEITAAVAALTAALDDPTRLRGAPLPELAAVEPPAPVESSTTAIEVTAMSDLVEAEPAAAAAPPPIEVSGDPAVDDVGPATELHDVLVDDDVAAPAVEGWTAVAPGGGGGDEPARPAWADAVPSNNEAQADPFLDELRRAAGEDDGDAMDRFFSDADDERRSGWFRRKA